MDVFPVDRFNSSLSLGIFAGRCASFLFVSFHLVSLGNALKCTDDHPLAKTPQV